jgi:acyl carrier protein phosphodiesterase
MNYLAHLFLSGDNPDIILGNFIADHIKGSQLLAQPVGVQEGIKLHRSIDHFTDHHPVTEQGKERLRNTVGKYAPVALDVIYDHYLASTWSRYSHETLSDFLIRTYVLLDGRMNEMPPRTQYMYQYMRRDDWLGNYQYPEGVHRALTGLSRRTKFESHLDKAVEVMNDNYEYFSDGFSEFFPLLQKHVVEAALAMNIKLTV